MIIKSLELENIRSYKKQLIEFDDSINSLFGDIGSGKSTILHGIEFALFGFKRGDLEGYHILRKGEKRASVKLTLIDNKTNDTVEIYRGLKKSKTSGSITQENGYIRTKNNLLELSPQELNSRIFEILNFPKEFITKDKNLIYRFTTYTPQEQLKEILFSLGEKKLEVIRKIFGIDKYKNLSDAIQVYVSESKTNKKIIESKLEDKTQIKNELKDNNKEIKELSEKLEQVKSKEKILKEKILKCQKAIFKRDEFLEKLNAKKITIEKKLSQLNETKNQMEIDIRKSDKIKKEIASYSQKEIEKTKLKLKKRELELESELKDISKSLDALQKNKIENEKFIREKDKLEKKLIDLNYKKESLKNESKSFDYMLTKCRLNDSKVLIRKLSKKLENLKGIKDKVENNKKERLKIELEIEDIQNQLKDKKNKIKQISKLEICPVCVQKICKEHKKSIGDEFKQEILDMEIRIKKLKETLNKVNKDLKENSNRLNELDRLETNLIEEKEKCKHLTQLEKKERHKYDELRQLRNQIEELEKLNIAKRLKEIETNLKSIKDDDLKSEKLNEKDRKLREELSEIKLKLEGLNNQKKDIEKLKEQGKELEGNIKNYKERLSSGKMLSDIKNKISSKEAETKKSKLKYTNHLDELLEKEKSVISKKSSFEVEILSKERNLKEAKKKALEHQKLENELKQIISTEKFLSEKVMKIINLIERAIFTKYYSEFNEEFEYLFKELIEDNEIDVRLNEFFEIIVEQNGYDIDIKNLSGGEKSSLAVAYRLSLKKIVENNLENAQKLNILILDEPTDGFSNEQVDRLGSILKQSNIKQIILVSHDEKIESISDKVLRIEKINHISSVT